MFVIKLIHAFMDILAGTLGQRCHLLPHHQHPLPLSSKASALVFDPAQGGFRLVLASDGDHEAAISRGVVSVLASLFDPANSDLMDELHARVMRSSGLSVAEVSHVLADNK